MKLFQAKIKILGHDIYQGTITLISSAIEFANKFLVEIKDKKQSQRITHLLESFNNGSMACKFIFYLPSSITLSSLSFSLHLFVTLSM